MNPKNLGAVRTMIPGVYILPDRRYLVRVTWSPVIDGRKRFFEIVRFVDGDLEDAARVRLEARATLRATLAPGELFEADGRLLGRVFAGRVIRDRPPTRSIPRPPASLFEAASEE